MNKVIIKSIQIRQGVEKILFQIKLPRNTKKVNSIKVTTRGYIAKIDASTIQSQHIDILSPKVIPKPIDQNNVASPFTKIEIAEQEMGSLWLSIPERRNVTFCEIVKAPTQQYDLIGFTKSIRLLRPFGLGTAWVEGKKESFFSIEIDPTTTIIEGFYSNLLPDLTIGYQLNIYLNLTL